MEIGRGKLEAKLFLNGDLNSGLLGGTVDYGHRITEDLSLFGQGWTGYAFGTSSGLEYGVQTGIRWRF